ncbi:hypothetical protein M422DRAFT_262825 [Sphaerobolus stellatus SS14]|uniref:Uncharacterized protein n=1 Tax=Sphaerobolus stellatus (strain SS14) TaxID=990650 RepID=A0A0C9TX89_SPHS4|nr:hypothetical protein M422DRAFT_262825 [Sphaerobolus stellatus SS14]
MSHNRGHRRMQAEELSAMDVEDSEPTTGLTMGDLTNSPSLSVDPQQSPRVLTPEHTDEPYAQAYGSQTAPSRVQSPSRVVGTSRTATQGLSPSRLAGASGTAHQGRRGSESGQHSSDAYSDPGRVSPTRGDTEEHFIIPASEVGILHQEYSEFITLKDNAEVVLAEAMEAMEWLNTFLSIKPAKAATQRIIDQTSMMEPAPGSGAEEHARTTRSRVPGDWYSWPPLSRDIPHPARSEQSDDSQPRRGREAHTVYAHDTREERVTDKSRTRFACDIRVTEGMHMNLPESTRLPLTLSASLLSAEQVIQGIPESIERPWCSITDSQSIDMNALREEIKETISATIKEKLCSDADSVTTVSQSMQALDVNAQYWSDLSNKAVRRSWRALELQLKLAEEKVNNLLHEEAPEEALLEAAQEAQTIRFQLDQNMRLCKAGLMPEQQVRFSANTGRVLCPDI